MPSPNHYHKSNTSNFGFFQFACELERASALTQVSDIVYIAIQRHTCQWQSLECAFFFLVCRLLHCMPPRIQHPLSIDTKADTHQSRLICLSRLAQTHKVGCWHYNWLVFRIVFEKQNLRHLRQNTRCQANKQTKLSFLAQKSNRCAQGLCGLSRLSSATARGKYSQQARTRRVICKYMAGLINWAAYRAANLTTA